MSNNIFSTYRAGENRVTASVLAVLRSLALGRCERILGALLEQSEFELVRFQNQPSKGSAGVPDAEISSSFRVLIETKTRPGTVRHEQLTRHVQRFTDRAEQIQRLLVITPDLEAPDVIDQIGDDRIVWASFASLDQAIEELLSDNDEVISEREAFLLRELQGMLEEDKLISPSKDTLVIPGRHAWPEYKEFYAYVCQPRRSFRQVSHIAFYTKNQIRELVPEMLESHESVKMSRGVYSGELGRLVDYLLDRKLRTENREYKVVLLTPPDDDRTVRLDKPVQNDLQSASGRITAFTQGQRYVRLSELKKAQKTSDLC
ncbi:MAG: hypothetical protein QM570_06550 [Planctomycetota bacterium]|nr:hypothetical protein [Planctomycetota bacterium]